MEQLLQLWRFGLASMPSIDSLEKQWGARWRPSKEKQYFSSRKAIIDEIVRRSQAQGRSEEETAKEMDAERTGSLDRLWKDIKAQHKNKPPG